MWLCICVIFSATGYSAPIHLYSSLNSRPILTYASQLGEVNLCVGQLPKQYSSDPSGIPDHMNDMNREEPSRYVSTPFPTWQLWELWLHIDLVMTILIADYYLFSGTDDKVNPILSP